MTTDDFKDDTVSKLAKRESEMAEMRNTIDKMADKLDKETKAQEELKTKYEDLLAKAQKLEQSLNLETVSRMKLEEVVKEVGASIPDDAKIANLASMGALPPSMLLAASESVLSPAAAPPPPPPPAGFAPPPPPPMFGAPGAPPPPPMMGRLTSLSFFNRILSSVLFISIVCVFLNFQGEWVTVRRNRSYLNHHSR